jgi:hemolysin activation/secretion protein
VRVKEAKQFGTSFSFDNYTPPSIAPERATIGAKYRDLLGMGMNYLLLMALGRI